MSDPQNFGVTECPKCKKLVIIIEGEELPQWQFICTCGTAFELKKIDEQPEE